VTDRPDDLGRRMMEEGILRQDDLLKGLPPPGPAAPPARLGRYEILGLLGKGASGEVFLARDPAIGREVAVKFLASHAAGGRFDREARILGSLRHPNIVAVHDAGVEAGRPWFVMDRIDGRSLQEALREGPLAIRERVSILRDVALACHFAHEKSVIHRDLKPANILLDRAGRPFVTDFGIAKPLDARERMTLTGTTVGTPWYMSPEQADGGSEGTDPRSDVFSLGVILYEMLAGRVPFQGETFFQVARAVIHDHPPLPAPAELGAVALKAMEKAPARRYRTARAFADELSAWLEGRPVSARPPSAPRRMGRWLRRRPAVAVGLGAILLAAAGLALLQARLAREARESAVLRRIDDELRKMTAWDVELYKPPQQIGYRELAKSADELEQIVRTSGLATERLSAAFYGIARARIRMGRADEALDDLDRAVAAAPPREAAGYLLERARVVWEVLLRETIGRNAQAAGRLAQEVRDDLRSALARGLEDRWDRDFAQALLGALDAKDPGVAERTVAACTRLREAKEKPAEEAWKLLGDLHLMAREPDRAIEAYREALRIRQCYVQAKTGLAMAHLARFSRGSEEEAQLVLRHAWEAVEMNAAYGETYHLFSLACRFALRRRPDQWAWGGEDFLRLCRQGIEVFERGRSARPDFPPLETALGIIRVFEGAALVRSKQSPDPALRESVRAFERVVSGAPDAPEGYAGLGLAHGARAMWLIEEGRDASEPLGLATESLVKALVCDPRSAEAHRWMGYVHFMRREPARARADWQKAIEVEPAYREELERMISRARDP
jgi:tetratricopeptide (TPR) repeat protein/predicted Ser/Thr protein kinase